MFGSSSEEEEQVSLNEHESKGATPPVPALRGQQQVTLSPLKSDLLNSRKEESAEDKVKRYLNRIETTATATTEHSQPHPPTTVARENISRKCSPSLQK